MPKEHAGVILLVDDDSREASGVALSAARFSVMDAEDRKVAPVLARTRCPDVIDAR